MLIMLMMLMMMMQQNKAKQNNTKQRRVALVVIQTLPCIKESNKRIEQLAACVHLLSSSNTSNSSSFELRTCNIDAASNAEAMLHRQQQQHAALIFFWSSSAIVLGYWPNGQQEAPLQCVFVGVNNNNNNNRESSICVGHFCSHCCVTVAHLCGLDSLWALIGRWWHRCHW